MAQLLSCVAAGPICWLLSCCILQVPFSLLVLLLHRLLLLLLLLLPLCCSLF
jgi:hypothetical protein